MADTRQVIGPCMVPDSDLHKTTCQSPSGTIKRAEDLKPGQDYLLHYCELVSDTSQQRQHVKIRYTFEGWMHKGQLALLREENGTPCPLQRWQLVLEPFDDGEWEHFLYLTKV
ncbi:MAG TPA: hypothetical protein VD907_00130 [Verrucomicrobiae bacterium]|nr:hypothetical protein [Verrucomicrobiae bacterium]